ncbi:hypothetical protein WJ41_13915 [Burkholderia ubonensis]|nr:hypothetical protein WJ41_13915 [Burkholderia ubonensis]
MDKPRAITKAKRIANSRATKAAVELNPAARPIAHAGDELDVFSTSGLSAMLKTTLNRVAMVAASFPTYSRQLQIALGDLASALEDSLQVSLEIKSAGPCTFYDDLAGWLQPSPLPDGTSIVNIEFELVNHSNQPVSGYIRGRAAGITLLHTAASGAQYQLAPGESKTGELWFFGAPSGRYAIRLEMYGADESAGFVQWDPGRQSLYSVPAEKIFASCEYPYLAGSPAELDQMLVDALGIQAQYDANGNLFGLYCLDREGTERRVRLTTATSYQPNYRIGGVTASLKSTLTYSEHRHGPLPTGALQDNSFTTTSTSQVDLPLTISGDVASAQYLGTTMTIDGFVDPSKAPDASGHPIRSRMQIGGAVQLAAATATTTQITVTAYLGDSSLVNTKKVGVGVFTVPAMGPVSAGSYVGDDVSMATNLPLEAQRLAFFAPFARSQAGLYVSLMADVSPPSSAPVSKPVYVAITAGLWFVAGAACRSLAVPNLLSVLGCVGSLVAAVAVPVGLDMINEAAARVKKSGTPAPAPSAPPPPAESPGGATPSPTPPPPWEQCYSSLTCPPGYECQGGQCVYVAPPGITRPRSTVSGGSRPRCRSSEQRMKVIASNAAA